MKPVRLWRTLGQHRIRGLSFEPTHSGLTGAAAAQEADRQAVCTFDGRR